jgi:hypothetical protein
LADLALQTYAPVQICGTVDLAYGRIETRRPGAPNAAIEHLNTQDDLQHFGVTAPLGGGELQLSRGDDKTSRASTDKRTTTTLGHACGLSSRTDRYAFSMTDKRLVGTATNHPIGIRHKF